MKGEIPSFFFLEQLMSILKLKLLIMKTIKFPEDFVKMPHRVVPGAVQYLYEYKDDADNMISIVAGSGLWGDGVRTFEMWDTKHMYDPRGYMTIEEINEWLNQEHEDLMQEGE
jgi:hypothetical protein